MSDSSSPGRILIVDDDPIVAASIAQCLTCAGYNVAAANGGDQALELIRALLQTAEVPAAFCGDDCGYGHAGHRRSGADQTDRGGTPTIVPIVISGYASIERAVAAVKQGAMDVLTKPLADEELRLAVSRAVQQHLLRRENASLRESVSRLSGMQGMVGHDTRMERIFELVETIARCSEFQLRGLTEQLASMSEGVALPATLAESGHARSLDEMMKECERSILTSALTENDWNRQKTADLLKINRATLYKKINSLGIRDRTSTG